MHTTITEADIPDHLPDEDPSDYPRATYATGLPIIFGHWAKLNIKPGKVPGIFPLDSGCAHRGRFTALRLEDGRVFRIRCYNDSYP